MILDRLIDGKPSDSGMRIQRRATLLMIPAIVVANLVGAIVVFVFATFVIPVPNEIEDDSRVAVVNLAVAGGYVIFATAVGATWGVKRQGVTRRWLKEGRAPDEREQRVALRGPFRLLLVHAVLWGFAVFVFGALNLFYDPILGLEVAITVALGGVTTSAVAFLLAERIMRPGFARALQYGAPARPVTPGVQTRLLFTWVLGAGVPLVGLGFVAVAALLGDEVDDDELAVTILGLGGLGLVVGLLITWLTARATAAPVVSVRSALSEVERGKLDEEVPVFDGSELGLLQAGFNRMVGRLRDRERLRDLFGRHVGEDVARAALEEELELGGEVKDVAVLFVDVVGSTRLAAERPPTEVVDLLNRFFAVVVDVVESHGGLVNKFEGDAALVIFGAPIPREDAARRALAAARELAERLEREVPELQAAVGVSGGEAVAGNVGAEHRFEYTVIGDPVNEAARLSELAKERPGRVLGSASLLERAGDDEAAHWSVGDSVELRGRTEETRLAAPAARDA